LGIDSYAEIVIKVTKERSFLIANFYLLRERLMPKVTEAHLEARRQQVLDAARACFARQGFHQTTMQDICREAGLSPGAVYRYFASKEDIISATCEVTGEVALIESIQERGDTLAAFEALAAEFFGRLDSPEAQPELRMTIQLWGEALRNPAIMELSRRNLDGIRGSLAQLVRQAQARGDINPDLGPQAVAQVLVSTFDGLVLQKAIEPTIDTWQYVAVIKAMVGGDFWRGKRPDQNPKK
jgi:AcrR family transcriptional regulator